MAVHGKQFLITIHTIKKMNRVTLLGRVGGDPEVKEFNTNKVAKFSLATSETFKKNDEKVTETTWHNLVFWGKQCDILKEYVHKGDQLLVEGKIQVRQYDDKNGVKHWTTEIVCDRFELIGGKPKAEKEAPQAQEKWHGKQPVKSMSKAEDLPGYIAEQHEASSNNMDDLPY